MGDRPGRGHGLISGVSIFVNGLVVKEFSDPVALTGARNAMVGLVLLGVLLAHRRRGRGSRRSGVATRAGCSCSR